MRDVSARRDRVADLREQGVSQRTIAGQLGVSLATIQEDCLIVGAVRPGQERMIGRRLKPCTRNGKVIRPFSLDEDARLQAWSADGITYKEMGLHLGRIGSVCRKRLCALARIEEAAGNA